MVPTSKRRRQLLQFELQDEEEAYGGDEELLSPLSNKTVVAVAKANTCKGSEKPLLDPFPLPQNFRVDVELALKTGKMTRETQKAFISAIAGSMLTYKCYPTKEEFTRVATNVVRKYTFLRSQVGSPTVSVLFYYSKI